MEITFLGHDCFRLRGREVSLVTDPYSPPFGDLPAGLQADIVTVSHDHPGHNYVEAVGGTPRAVRGPGEYEIKGALINGVGTFHDGNQGKERGRNTVYVIEIDDLTVCHLGDLGHVLSAEQLDEIGSVDVLLVPAGDPTTLPVTRVAEVISQVEPSVVIPMNYMPGAEGGRHESLEKFCHEMGVKEYTPQARLTVTRGSLPGETQVVILGAK